MIQETARLSIAIQFLTTGIDIWGLSIPTDPKYKILKQLLQLEIIVQITELIFYIWLFRNFKKINNITPFRYMDWMLTTPTMLFQLMAFLKYDIYTDTNTFFKAHKKEVSRILVLNWTMMIIGLLGETKQISMNTASTIGFIPFLSYFGMIYHHFVPKEKNETNKIKKYVYWYYTIVWGLYGVASFFPYEQKNSMYNILDLFAKNFYGLFLVWYISKETNGFPLTLHSKGERKREP
jgi:bacteriorhodopsin